MGRKTANKISKKVELDFDIDKKSSKKAKTKIKKMNTVTLFLAIVFLLIGAVGGYFGFNIFIKDDCFELIGKDEISLIVGKKYKDDGCKVIAFGKDESDKVKVETNLTINPDGSYTSNEEGTFYITYTVDNFKYGKLFKIQKIRLITFVLEPEEDEVAQAHQN